MINDERGYGMHFQDRVLELQGIGMGIRANDLLDETAVADLFETFAGKNTMGSDHGDGAGAGIAICLRGVQQGTAGAHHIVVNDHELVLHIGADGCYMGFFTGDADV